MSKLSFWIKDHGESYDDAEEFDVKWFDGEIEGAASEYAEYYHDNRDGWESSWPIVFSLADETGKYLGDVSVDRESVPHFYGRAVVPGSNRK